LTAQVAAAIPLAFGSFAGKKKKWMYAYGMSSKVSNLHLNHLTG
jgi:hypothetical protein